MAKQTRDAEFTEFVAARAPWLRKVAYLLCGDWHRADDLVQESVTKLYVRWSRLSRLENLDGYARTVLVNTFLAEQRSPGAAGPPAAGPGRCPNRPPPVPTWTCRSTSAAHSRPCRRGSGPPWCCATTAT